MKCTKCHTEIPKDSMYCLHCGQQIIKENFTKKYIKYSTDQILDNKYVDISRKLFCIAFLGFDLILSTVISLFTIPNIWVFIISVMIYIASVVYGILAMKLSLHFKRDGKAATGLLTSICLIMTSLFIIYVNIASMIRIF